MGNVKCLLRILIVYIFTNNESDHFYTILMEIILKIIRIYHPKICLSDIKYQFDLKAIKKQETQEEAPPILPKGRV